MKYPNTLLGFVTAMLFMSWQASAAELTAAPPAMVDGESLAVLQSAGIGVEFALQTGTYNLTFDKTLAISNACATVEGWSSADDGCQRRVAERSDNRLLIECSRRGAPTLLLEFKLHPAFVELRTGLKNTTAEPVRIKKYWPLAGGVPFPGEPWTDVRTLDAPSGAHQPSVSANPGVRSANNLLLTCKQAGKRRSLVLGALKTADFTKWAYTMMPTCYGSPFSLSQPGLRVMDYLDCGASSPSSSFQVTRGKPYAWQNAPEPFGTTLFDEKAVEFQANKLDPKKRYALGFSWWDFDANGRVESVVVTGSDKQSHTLVNKCPLPRQDGARSVAVSIPAGCYADGNLTIAFNNEAPVPNAVVSEIWLWEMADGAILPSTVTDERNNSVAAGLEAYDPIGRLVDPGETYMPADTFYVDAGTANPFEALEQYGQALREATGAKPNVYDFPTVCAWYAGVWKTGGAQDNPENSLYKINTSSGMVEEAQKMKASGFLNYSRAAVRLVPDSYTKNNPQGWWDDAHWQKHGYYTAPYETTEKLGQGMHDAGCLAFTYIQPQIQFPKACQRISRDFREAHPDWLLNKQLDRNLDYSLPQVQEHVCSRFNALRGNLDGFMVDYCDELWMSALYGHVPEERLGRTPWESVDQTDPAVQLADPKMTASAVYRAFFTSLRQGIGPDARIHERSLFQPNNELTLGIVDSYRTAVDTDKITPDIVSRSGLRWYKNRVVIAYDMDSKELASAWKVDEWTGTDQDGRRMMLTMAYVAASRLLLANSFRDLKSEVLYDLERTFPYPTEPRSARPVDAFSHKGLPRVYDFAVTPDWHQVTLFNNTLPTKEETITVSFAGENVDGALGLDPAAEYHVYDFWNDRFVGTFNGSDTLSQVLRPGEARILSIRKGQKNPQVLSTNRHIMQGYLELADVKWTGASLSGKAKVVAGEPFKLTLSLNGRQPIAAQNLTVSADGKLAVLTLECPKNETAVWRVQFK